MSLWLVVLLLGTASPVIPIQRETKLGEVYQVPYRLLDTKHIMVRVKINGKGPFHLILDTGAPTVYLSPDAAKRAGATPDQENWATIKRFELEGGASLSEERVRIEEPPQLSGMNALGFAGVELHGVLGYTLLSQFRMEIDLTRTSMTWTKRANQPPVIFQLKAEAPEGLDTSGLKQMESLSKLVTSMLKRAAPVTVLRGTIGVELIASKNGARIANVLPASPAAAADIRKNDEIRHVVRDGKPREIKTPDDLLLALKEVEAGDALMLRIQRDGKMIERTVRSTKGGL